LPRLLGATLSRFRQQFGGKKTVDRILAAYEQKLNAKNKGMSSGVCQNQEEVLLSIAITCLDRLIT